MAAQNCKRNREELDENYAHQNNPNEPSTKAMRLNNNSRLECKEWDCTVCTYLNPQSSLKCAMCEQPNILQTDNTNCNDDISSFLCIVCHTTEGYDISCSKSHKLCIKCTKQYILNGIKSNLFEKQSVQCPSPNNDCCNGVIPYWLINQCQLNEEETSSFEDQQNKYNIFTIRMCNVCRDDIGIDLQCDHNLCIKCGKKYILSGIVTEKWKKEKLSCPIKECCQTHSTLSISILKQFNLSQNVENALEEMQNEYIKSSMHNITECPKCKETYSTETGDINIEKENLSAKHKKHKTKFRFRCLKPVCGAIFCSGCKSIPYHVGYSCVEYKQYQQSKKCRFCGNVIHAPTAKTVCNSNECLSKKQMCCDQIYECGHHCIGVKGHECFGCLNKKCLAKAADLNEEDFCNICWVDSLRSSPSIKLECGHYFHFECVKQKVSKKWPSARITFGFLNCPLCKKEMRHSLLADVVGPHYKLRAEVQKEAIERVKIEGLGNDERLSDAHSAYYNNLAKYALDRLAFYPCSKCKKAYFGGMKRCEEAGSEQEEKYNGNDLICGACSSGSKKEICSTHGTNYISYKCKYCCNLAVWFCWGTTHFCDPCHSAAGQKFHAKIETLPLCKGKDTCPLGIKHAPNGTAEVCLGCVVCLRK